MKEIGGYFEFEELYNNEYYKDLISLNSARNSLMYAIYANKVKKIYVPFYLCDSISNVLKKNNISFEYYNVDEEFMPIFNKELKKNEYIYIVNYFGIFDNLKIKKFYKKYKNIIIDNTHAFFQKPIKKINTIYSCRKFFGVPDGSYLNASKKYNKKLEQDKSRNRFIHLFGRYEESASEFYSDFSKSNKDFASEDIKVMSKLTHNLMGAINYNKVKRIRKENYDVLEKQLSKYNKLNIPKISVPFCYPLYIDEGIKLRKYLIDNKIYIPVLWPNVSKCGQKLEEDYANNILPVPCDQRYTKKDMQKIIDLIKKFMDKK